MTTTPDRMCVVIPVDFSETSRRALAWALDYSLRGPCELHVVHVTETSAGDLMPHIAAARATQDVSNLDELVYEEIERIVPHEDRGQIGPILRHVTEGTPHRAILRIAQELKADLIVMGTHGRTGLAHLVSGSVAEQVVRRARCPVVCVKPIEAEATIHELHPRVAERR
jgi:nucleotide-binding universal stress UspA family protein